MVESTHNKGSQPPSDATLRLGGGEHMDPHDRTDPAPLFFFRFPPTGGRGQPPLNKVERQMRSGKSSPKSFFGTTAVWGVGGVFFFVFQVKQRLVTFLRCFWHVFKVKYDDFIGTNSPCTL